MRLNVAAYGEQLHRWSITYDERDHLFRLVIDGKELARAASYIEAEHERDAYFRAEHVLANVQFPEGRLALTVAEVAKALGMGREAIMQSINSGELKAFRLGERTMRISIWALKDWIDEQQQVFQQNLQPDLSLLTTRKYTRRK